MNKLLRFLGYAGVYIWTFIQTYLISFVLVQILLGFICFVVSIFRKLPDLFVTKYWAVSLISSVPLTIALFIYIVIDARKELKVK